MPAVAMTVEAVAEASEAEAAVTMAEVAALSERNQATVDAMGRMDSERPLPVKRKRMMQKEDANDAPPEMKATTDYR